MVCVAGIASMPQFMTRGGFLKNKMGDSEECNDTDELLGDMKNNFCIDIAGEPLWPAPFDIKKTSYGYGTGNDGNTGGWIRGASWS